MIRIYMQNASLEGLYVNGVLHWQDDTIEVSDLIQVVNENLGLKIETVFMNEKQEKKVYKNDGFPEHESTLLRWAK